MFIIPALRPQTTTAYPIVAVKRINVDELKVGMYISRLDRPWRETKFDFQGFHVGDESLIDEVKQQTQYVYILVPDEQTNIPLPRQSGDLEVDSATYDEAPDEKPMTPIEDELAVARESYKDIAEMLAEIKKALEANEALNLPRIQQTIKYMVRSIERNPDAYIWLSRIKSYSSHAFNQALRASVWATALGRKLDLDEQVMNDIALGSLLMDVGFARVPDEILEKTSELTQEEWEIVKTHVQHGREMVAVTPGVPSAVMKVIDTHHERLDGSGYPRGARGSAIPLAGQIAGIVDFFAGTTRLRPFMKPLSASAALQLLYKQRENYFSSKLVDNFIHTVGIYPTGFLVELNTGEVGVVSSQNPGWRLRPRIILLLDADKTPYGSYPIINLLERLTDEQDRPIHIGRSLADGEYNINVEQIAL